MTHLGVVRNSEREVLPACRLKITEDAIYETESGLQLQVSPVVLGSTMGCRVKMDLNAALSDSSPMHLC